MNRVCHDAARLIASRAVRAELGIELFADRIERRAVKARALDAFERELLKTESMNVSFSAVRWNAMVERVDVLADGRMVFRFVCGREIVV